MLQQQASASAPAAAAAAAEPQTQQVGAGEKGLLNWIYSSSNKFNSTNVFLWNWEKRFNCEPSINALGYPW